MPLKRYDIPLITHPSPPLARLHADVRLKFRIAVVNELKQLGVGTSPGVEPSERASALWNASAVILENGFISFRDFELLLRPSTDDHKVVVSSNIFLQRDDVERFYFQSKPVEDFMRFKFIEQTQRNRGTTVRASTPHCYPRVLMRMRWPRTDCVSLLSLNCRFSSTASEQRSGSQG
jgi:hypothetical protein